MFSISSWKNFVLRTLYSFVVAVTQSSISLFPIQIKYALWDMVLWKLFFHFSFFWVPCITYDVSGLIRHMKLIMLIVFLQKSIVLCVLFRLRCHSGSSAASQDSLCCCCCCVVVLLLLLLAFSCFTRGPLT